jgi:hypothetical protein
VLDLLVLLVLADAHAPDMQLSSCSMPPLDRLEQLGLPSDHTPKHLVKQVALSCLFPALR